MPVGLCREGSQEAKGSHISEGGTLPRQGRSRELLGPYCTWPRENAHDTRMNINHLFLYIIFIP